jgi:hypothetical protein
MSKPKAGMTSTPQVNTKPQTADAATEAPPVAQAESAPVVDEAPVVEARQPIPNVGVLLAHTDERKAKADYAGEQEPGHKHVYKDSNVTEADKFRHGLEPVKHKDIYPDCPDNLADLEVRDRGDILCRQSKDEYQRTKQAGENLSRQLVEQSMQKSDDPDAEEWTLGNETRKKRDPKELRKLHR